MRLGSATTKFDCHTFEALLGRKLTKMVEKEKGNKSPRHSLLDKATERNLDFLYFTSLMPEFCRPVNKIWAAMQLSYGYVVVLHVVSNFYGAGCIWLQLAKYCPGFPLKNWREEVVVRVQE